MCMALPGGSQPETPKSLRRRLLQWLGFSALVARLLVTGFALWIVQRWILRKPNVY